jgi:MFS family permease
MAGSMLAAAAGSAIFAAAQAIEMAYLGRMLIGAGVACTFVGALTVTAQTMPPARFAMLAGVVQMLGMVGAIFGQAPLAALVAALGWRGALVAMGVLAAAIGLALHLVLRDRPGTAAPQARLSDGLRAVARVRETWACAIFGFAMTGPMLAFGGLWAVPYFATVYELPRTTAAAITTLIFAGWGVGAPLVGWISDRLGRRREPMLACAAIAGLALAAVVFGPRWPLWALVPILMVHGACASAMVLAFAMVREQNDPAANSVAMAVVNTFVVGSGALLQPLIGWLLDLGWTGQVAGGARVYPQEAFAGALSILPPLFVFALLAGLAMRERPRAR